jgi:TRAP-type mannitol/chloroaromatic compound transport system permease small subunit
MGSLPTDMQRIHTIRRGIEKVTSGFGRGASWLALLLVGIGTLNTVLRYIGGWLGVSLTSNSLGDIQWMLYSAMFLLGAGWTLQQDAHVRVDVLYERFGPRRRAWVDLLGSLLLLLPFCAFGLWVSWDYVLDSVRGLETSADAGQLPIWPAKLLILAGFSLLALQGVAVVLRSVATLAGSPPEEPD